MIANVTPERIIKATLELAVTTIKGDTTILDRILGGADGLPEEEMVMVRESWTKWPPKVIQGYPRTETVIPCYAIVLTSDNVAQDYIGVGEEPGGEDEGDVFRRRNQGTYTVFVYAGNVDVCIWYYRVLRYIANVAIPRFTSHGLDPMDVQGAELMPDPRYAPDNVYTRRLSLVVQHEERWSNRDPLWQALNGPPDPTGTSVNVAHEDTGGGVHPTTGEDDE